MSTSEILTPVMIEAVRVASDAEEGIVPDHLDRVVKNHAINLIEEKIAELDPHSDDEQVAEVASSPISQKLRSTLIEVLEKLRKLEPSSRISCNEHTNGENSRAGKNFEKRTIRNVRYKKTWYGFSSRKPSEIDNVKGLAFVDTSSGHLEMVFGTNIGLIGYDIVGNIERSVRIRFKSRNSLKKVCEARSSNQGADTEIYIEGRRSRPKLRLNKNCLILKTWRR